MTDEEEWACRYLVRIHNSTRKVPPRIRNRMTLAFSGIALQIAGEFYRRLNRYYERTDIQQEAMYNLSVAISDLVKCPSGWRVGDHPHSWLALNVRRRMFDRLIRHSRMRHARKVAMERQVKRDLEQRLGRPSTEQEMADATGQRLDQIVNRSPHFILENVHISGDLESRSIGDRVQRVLRDLPLDQQVLVHLYFLQEKSVREVAMETGHSVYETGIAIRQLREALRDSLRDLH